MKKTVIAATFSMVALTGCAGTAPQREPQKELSQSQAINIDSKYDVVLSCAGRGNVQMLVVKDKADVIKSQRFHVSEFQRIFDKTVEKYTGSTGWKRALGLPSEAPKEVSLNINC